MDEIVHRISSLLVAQGTYRQLQTPIKIGDIDFKFEGALEGPGTNDGLVVIATAVEATAALLVRRIKGLVTLLDRFGSRRSVTAIFVVRGSTAPDISELEKYCHVVTVRPDVALDRSLRTLLPLTLPPAEKETEGAEQAVRKELESHTDDPFVESLLDAAKTGVEAIKECISKALQESASTLSPQVTEP